MLKISENQLCSIAVLVHLVFEVAMQNHNEESYTAEYKMDYLRKVHGTHYFVLPKRTAKQAIYLFHKILAILETSGSPTFLGCDPLSKTSQLYCILRSKLNLNEESSDKSINSQSAFVDMPVRTTSACCEKLDRNSDSQVISN
ncbi:hypothetical protein T03_17388 [Trichinella britovi]|uniref:Uncharacterized protein n=1 Tax=Trichinella britovi TaxID=45882 RepID=A0A0V1D256_TRIBR|nr:hypothetical protein T03_17388 [Trichinella britovi]